MRIVYVIATWPPEVNGVALTAARAVAHAVTLVRPRQAGESRRDDRVEWRSAGAPIPMYPELRFGIAGVAGLRRRWRALRPALVHAATPGPLARAALAAARAEGIATSAEFRTRFHACSRHHGLGGLEPLVLGWLRRLHAPADASFAPTPALARELEAAGFGRVEVLGRGVDTARFGPALRAEWGAAPEDPVLLTR